MTNSNLNWTRLALLGGILSAAVASSRAVFADNRFDAAWRLPISETVEQQLTEWLAIQPIDDDARHAALREFNERIVADGDLLTAVIHALAICDDRALALAASLETAPPQLSANESAWLESAESARFDVRHLRLLYARALNESRRHDEALRWMQDLEPQHVVCPDVLLFERAVAHHQLVQADEALDAIDELQRCESTLPVRYVRLASIMRADLEPLQADSLDHIGRRMSDVTRRLDIGQLDKPTMQVEEGIIASLDKLIKEAEDERERQMQQLQASPSQPPPSTKAMEDSRIAELKGPGKVDPRRLGEDTQWGSLPPQERERIMQQLGRDFPAHYREVIEEYFRKLASENEKSTERP